MTSHATAVAAAATAASGAAAAARKHPDVAAAAARKRSRKSNPGSPAVKMLAPKLVIVAPQNIAATPRSVIAASQCPAQCVHVGTPIARIAASNPSSRSPATLDEHATSVYVQLTTTARGRNFAMNPYVDVGYTGSSGNERCSVAIAKSERLPASVDSGASASTPNSAAAAYASERRSWSSSVAVSRSACARMT